MSDLSKLTKRDAYTLLSQIAWICYDKYPPSDLAFRDAVQEISAMAEEHVEDE